MTLSTGLSSKRIKEAVACLRPVSLGCQKERFSNLLLEYGERQLQDWAVVASSSLGTLSSTDHGPPSTCMGRIDGRLKLCSNSIVFEPNDWSRGIIRLPFQKVTSLPTLQVDQADQTVVIKCSRHLVMKVHNVIAPYDNYELATVFKFTFLHSTPQRFLELTHLLLQQSPCKSLTPPDRPFDPCNLCNVRETPLTPNLRCSILSPLQSLPGCAIVTNTHIYHQPFGGITQQPLATKARNWALDDIVGFARRYNNGLKDSGLELFVKSSSVLLAFDTCADRERVIRLLPPDVSCHTDREFVMQALECWQAGTLSNFEYLLALNSAAGRTFHDLSRYPVFPWVIQDYTSNKLDLTLESSFRDLSKPVGALDEKRLEYFLSRYESMKEAGSMDAPFIYGTHYSAPGYVLYYLVRSMPEHMLCLQNGKFDSPDRMFHSVEHCFASVLTNHADVKELIPEFYHGGFDFLINARNLNLGITQNGDRLHDVVLPPWAKSARDFIKQNRKALECPYTTSKLPLWIDLIFGCKSRGKEAQRANNLFHNMAYFGPADLRQLASTEERNQAELQATEFGIVPDQLFSGAHPQRDSGDVIGEVVSKDLFIREDYMDLSAENAKTDQPWELLDSPTKDSQKSDEGRDRGWSADSLSDRPWAAQEQPSPNSPKPIPVVKTSIGFGSNVSPYRYKPQQRPLNDATAGNLSQSKSGDSDKSKSGWLSRNLGRIGSNEVGGSSAEESSTPYRRENVDRSMLLAKNTHATSTQFGGMRLSSARK